MSVCMPLVCLACIRVFRSQFYAMQEQPSPAPTLRPTEVPSPIPTAVPTHNPTVPTANPSNPSDGPTESPSDAPTGIPTFTPSATPTEDPSTAPSSTPTFAPSDPSTVQHPSSCPPLNQPQFSLHRCCMLLPKQCGIAPPNRPLRASEPNLISPEGPSTHISHVSCMLLL